MARHENLNVTIDMAMVRKLLNEGVIHLNKREDKKGEHKELTFFVKVRKSNNGNSIATHNVTIKNDGDWKDVRDKDGNLIFVGTATPSKFQPDEDGDDIYQKSHDNSMGDDSDEIF
jgi:hypothetical protein